MDNSTKGGFKKLSNIFDIEPCDFPDCPNCKSNYDVDIDEIDEQFICRKCGIQWNDDDYRSDLE